MQALQYFYHSHMHPTLNVFYVLLCLLCPIRTFFTNTYNRQLRNPTMADVIVCGLDIGPIIIDAGDSQSQSHIYFGQKQVCSYSKVYQVYGHSCSRYGNYDRQQGYALYYAVVVVEEGTLESKVDVFRIEQDSLTKVNFELIHKIQKQQSIRNLVLSKYTLAVLIRSQDINNNSLLVHVYKLNISDKHTPIIYNLTQERRGQCQVEIDYQQNIITYCADSTTVQYMHSSTGYTTAITTLIDIKQLCHRQYEQRNTQIIAQRKNYEQHYSHQLQISYHKVYLVSDCVIELHLKNTTTLRGGKYSTVIEIEVTDAQSDNIIYYPVFCQGRIFSVIEKLRVE